MDSFKPQVKVIISAFYWLLFLSWRNILWRSGLLPGGRSVVLMYHRVPKEMQDRFESQMRALARMARPVSIESLATRPPDGLGAAVTFDDAFVSVGENALGILRQLNIPAAVFVPVCHMGKKPGWPAGKDGNEEIMSAEQLRALPSDLITIASHSVTHPHLPDTPDNALRWELTHSRESLEQATGRPVRFFSYPYGEYSVRVEAAVRRAGYDAAFTITPVPVGRNRQTSLGRVCVEPTDGPIEFRLKLAGAYRWMEWVSQLKRTLKRALQFPDQRGAEPYRGRAFQTEQGRHALIAGARNRAASEAAGLSLEEWNALSLQGSRGRAAWRRQAAFIRDGRVL